MQFAGIPMNLLAKNTQADYIVTGHWSKEAFKEAHKYGDINCVVDGASQDYFGIPQQSDWKINSHAAYRYLCSNETLTGVQFHNYPNLDDVPLVVDMTSDFLSRPIEVEQFGLIFASTQKTMGTSGLCVVLVREDLLQQAQAITPSIVNYAIQAQAHSLYNTPNVFAIYVLGLMLDWLAEQGGVEGIAKIKPSIVRLKSFMNNLSTMGHQFADIMSYTFLIPLVGYLDYMYKDESFGPAEIKDIVSRLIASGAFIIGGNVIKDILLKISKDINSTTEKD
jgi:phosphoserine aminotransferase